MITPYSIRTGSKITGRIVKKLEVWARVIYVTFENGETRFISKKDFWKLFHQSRKQRAENLYISHCRENLFQVEGTSRPYYFVELEKNGVWCECEDYKNQKKYQKESSPICKHGWRTLNYVGFNNLNDYIKSNKYYSLKTCYT